MSLPRTGVPARWWRALVGALIGVLGLAVGGGTSAAQTDNTLVSSTPADGDAVATSPDEIVLVFESEVGNQNRVSMSCASNPFTAHGNPVRSDDGLTLTVEILEPMPQGSCNILWVVSQPSGEAGASGDFSFTVENESGPAPPGDPTEGSTVSTTPAGTDGTGGPSNSVLDATDVSDGPIWLGRVISVLGLAVLFGAFVLIAAAWPEGPEYILAVRFLRSVWVFTLVGTVLFVVGLTAAVNEESLGAGFNPLSWFDLFDAGWAGRAALVRLLLVVATGWVVLRPERVIDPTTQMLALGIPALAVATIGLARTGGELPVLGVAAGITHALAMSVWFGGVVLLARVVLAGPGEEDLVQAVRGFNRISTPAIVVTVLSGLVQVYRLDGGALFTTSHGRLMLLKAFMVAVMVFIGLTARQVAHSRLMRAHDLSAPAADRLRRAFGTEAVIGAIVLGLSGGLLALTPSKVPASAADFEIEKSIVDTDAGLDLTVALSPGRVGVNQLRVEVREPESGLTGLTVTLLPPAGSNLGAIQQAIPLSGAGVAVTPSGSGLPLRASGLWRMQVAASTGLGSVDAAENSFTVANADGSLPASDVPDVTTPTSGPSNTADPLAPGTTAG